MWFSQDEQMVQRPTMRTRPTPSSSPVQAAQPELQVRSDHLRYHAAHY